MTEKNILSSIGALVEHFDAKFNLLIDGYAALDKKIDDLRLEMDRRFNEVDERFKEVDRRLEAIELRLDESDDRFEVVFEELRDLRHPAPQAV
jgi:tetrahydromethanopterin S-methyltransferase subunit G